MSFLPNKTYDAERKHGWDFNLAQEIQQRNNTRCLLQDIVRSAQV